MSIGRLHIITDTRPGRDAYGLALAALEAGAPVIQVRGKDLADRELYELANRVAEACAKHGAQCIVNDRVHVALAVGAGAHVGDDDLPVDVARRVLGSDAVLGATARNPVTAQAHEVAGASYLGVGPCYGTSTKAGLPTAIGLPGLRAVVDAVDVPVIAIAGVTAERVPELLAAGAHGVAVVDAVSSAEHPQRAVEALLAALETRP